MEQAVVEGLADDAYRRAGMEPEQPNISRLARGLLGPDAIERGPRPFHGPGALIRVQETWRIVISRSLEPSFARFVVAHELAHYLFRLNGCTFEDADEERCANRLGAALLAPRRAWALARRSLGEELPALSEAFGLTETGAALRLGEAELRPIVVVCPSALLARGPEDWVWPDAATLRRWARQPIPGVRKTRLTDDPRRSVLDVVGGD